MRETGLSLKALQTLAAMTLTPMVGLSPPASADESGVSFWVPGQYGSFAAVAPDPGFSLPTVSYYYSGDMSANRILKQGTELAAGADTTFMAQFTIPTFTPDATFLGARPSFSLAILPAYNRTMADVSLGPLSARRTDSVIGFGDLYPTAQLFWSDGVNNWMAYVTGDIPVVP
jgi:hypothetical protein